MYLFGADIYDVRFIYSSRDDDAQYVWSNGKSNNAQQRIHVDRKYAGHADRVDDRNILHDRLAVDTMRCESRSTTLDADDMHRSVVRRYL